MKIIAIEAFVLSQRCTLVRVETDEGVVGWGDATLESHAHVTASAVRVIGARLIGLDPRQTTRLWQIASRAGFYRGGAVLHSAVAGLDAAFWDIKGRAVGAPVHQLLGGPVRDRIRIYAHCNGQEKRTGDPDLALSLVTEGYTLLKCAPTGPRPALDSPRAMDELVAELSELRETVGDGVDLALDLHGRLGIAQSMRLLPRLEDLDLLFVEEPVRPEHSHLLGRITSSTVTPIAVGERLHSRAEFLPVLQDGISIVQPDPAHAGGITECFRIAALAETFDALVAPHCPLGPIALAMCVQLDFAMPSFLAQEQTWGLGYASGADGSIVRNPEVLRADRGWLRPPTGPGLGIDVDEDLVRDCDARARRASLTGDVPIWSGIDGGYAEW